MKPLKAGELNWKAMDDRSLDGFREEVKLEELSGKKLGRLASLF
jgi:hypothetical protein